MKEVGKIDQISYWQALINEWLEGNLSQQRFCEEKRIDFTRFKNWRYRLNSKRALNKSKNDFIPLTITDDLAYPCKEGEVRHSSIEIYLADGKKIILREHLAEALVKRLLTVLHV